MQCGREGRIKKGILMILLQPDIYICGWEVNKLLLLNKFQKYNKINRSFKRIVNITITYRKKISNILNLYMIELPV